MSVTTEIRSDADVRDAARSAGGLCGACRPAVVLYLAACLAGLAIGLWPGAIYVARHAAGSAPRPALQCVAIGQVAYILLIHPLVLMRRSLQRGEKLRLLAVGVESAALMLAAAPFYVAAGFLADATIADAVRAGLYVGALWPVAWVCGAYLARGPGRTVAMLLLLSATLGLPAAWYVIAEFLPQLSADWLWSLAPATATWDAGASRSAGGSLLPSPTWSWLAWPAVAAIAALLRLVLCGRRSHRIINPSAPT